MFLIKDGQDQVLSSGCSSSYRGGGHGPCQEHQASHCPQHKREQTDGQENSGETWAPKAGLPGHHCIHVHDIDWPVSVTHEKYSVFIGLKDIQQVHVSTTVYEDKIVELRKGRGPCE